MAWYDPAFSFKKSFVIPHSNVSGGSDLLDFPLLLSFTDSSLKSLSNGGMVCSSNGYDLLFTDGTETRELPYEVESYTASSGALICWVRIPVLSASQDTLLYLYFGNGTVTGFQAASANVWSSGYKAVYHLSDNASTTTVVDSTVNVRNGTSVANTSTKTVSGEISNGLAFNGTTDKVTASGTGLATGASPWTISCWMKPTNSSNSNFPTLIGFDNWTSTSQGIFLYLDTSNVIEFSTGSGTNLINSGITATGGVFVHVAGVYTGTQMLLYVNGVVQGTLTTMLSLVTGSVTIGGDTFSEDFLGTLDEVRISNGARSSSWIATEYANQSTPNTFVQVGQTIPNIATADQSLLIASSVSSTQTSADQLNVGSCGAIFIVDVTSLPGGVTLTLNVQGRDVVSGQYYTLASYSGLTSGVSSPLILYPGIQHLTPSITNGVLPRTWRVQVVPSGGGASSYTVGVSLVC